MLDKYGIDNRTLALQRGKMVVTIFDKGEKLRSAAESVGEYYGDKLIEARVTRGRGDYIGAEDRETAAGEYRRIIDEYEKTVSLEGRYRDSRGRRFADYWHRPSSGEVTPHESTSYETAAGRLARRAAEIWESGAIYP